MALALIALNELMAFLTMLIAFPGLVDPKRMDGMELFMLAMMMIPMSVVWWLYLVVAPFAFGLMWALGDWKPSDMLKKWPWSHLRTTRS